MTTSSSKALWALAAVSLAAGCAREANQDGDDLQALLEDDDFTSIIQSAATVAAPDAGASVDARPSNDGFAPRDASFGDRARPGDGGMTDPSRPVGQWTLDDCNPFRTQLFDFSGNGNTAFRSVQSQCVPGIDGQGVRLPGPTDIIFVPDQPTFTFGQGVTVAAWVRPDRTDGVRTLFRKRESMTSSFALLVHDSHFQFVIGREAAPPASVSAPARAGQWTHVAATYDGLDLVLYLDGKEAARTRASGVIQGGQGPLLVGNDVRARRIEGTVDSLFFATRAATASTIAGLTCLRKPPTLVATPAMSAPVQPGTTVPFSLTLTSHNSPTCAPETFFFQVTDAPPDIIATPNFQSLPPLPSGATTRLVLNLRSDDDSAGPRVVTFSFFNFMGRGTMPVQGRVTYVLADDPVCPLSSDRSLMMRDVSVVDDPVRTGFTAPASDTRRGVWTFGRLMQDMAPTPQDAPAFTEGLFRTWLTDQTVNGFTVAARPAIRQLVLDGWPRLAGGALDLTRAPLRLLAIVNRMDLRDLGKGKAGEGRFVFGVLDRDGFQQEFTVILEYNLPASTELDVQRWAKDWQALSTLPFPSEPYNTALQTLTRRFAGRNAQPGRPNGSALSQLRTNEIALGSIWELREFTLSASSGALQETTIALTPDLAFNGSTALRDFVNNNEAAILAGTHVVPLARGGAPFRAGSVFNDLSGWDAPGIRNPEARRQFSINTCNGCHSGETGTTFLQVFPREPGQASSLSSFLTGGELGRRRTGLKQLLGCPVPPPPSNDGGVPDGRPRADGGLPVDARGADRVANRD